MLPIQEKTTDWNLRPNKKYIFEPIEDVENKETDEQISDEPIDDKLYEEDKSQNRDDTQENTPSSTQQPQEVIIKPTPVCNVCGSTWHIVHPTCPTCGSIEHTTHPAEQTPPTSSENAGMPEVYIDFD